jgi:hypothetical protein
MNFGGTQTFRPLHMGKLQAGIPTAKEERNSSSKDMASDDLISSHLFLGSQNHL